jgi:hypothetical protein
MLVEQEIIRTLGTILFYNVWIYTRFVLLFVCCNMTADLYSKPTDKHQYLSPSSCHPKHCFKSIPFSQAISLKRICSTIETTKQRLGDLRHHLKRRGYNDKVIEMLLGRRNATTGDSGNNLASVSLFSISFQWWRTMPEIFSKEGW